ncbi:aldehyde dehydrogenase family protein [Nocardioides sp. 1609]|uniref:aldehyde dehydrogenase family protein n=1 Tax=Nocardioides sp. 1609 TaxID=2508327 RepID=UPI001FD678C2|nr:aldehyde dehydrogenase family protein [Nocardioides sp. 1609]
MPTQVELFPMVIGGRERSASDGETLDAINPATGELLARVPSATADDVNDAVTAALTAASEWKRQDPQVWRDALLAIADLIHENGDELALLDVQDNGSPIREMRNDVRFAVECLRYYASLTMQVAGRTVPTSSSRLNYTLRQPFGVVARIIPFNHPLLFAASRIGAPLAAGNTVIIKPSEHTSLSAVRVAQLAQKVLPPGVVSCVTGLGATAGDALVTHPDIRRISFTGSAETGRRIVARAAQVNLKTVTLELGGKNPLVVFPDSDIDAAIAAAVRGMNFTWQGQSCGSTSRLIVHRDIYTDFVDAVASKVDAIRSGSPSDDDTETGAIVNQSQMDKVTEFIGIAHNEGARLIAGGSRLTDGDFNRGLFVRPTVFADVDPNSRLAQEEIFGPVLAVMPFNDYDHAMGIANSVQYGLTASVFTSDLGLAHRFARDIEAGYVWVNDVSRHVPATPFGGWKDSGLGREEDMSEVESFTQIKNVHVNFETEGPR